MAADSVFHKSDSDSVQTTPWTLQQMQPSHPPTQSHQGPRTRRPISPPPLTRDGSIASILDATSSVRQSPLRRAHESIPMRDFSAGDPMALSINTRLQTPQASTTPPSATRQFTTKRTPVASTPYRTDWDTKQFENALLEFSTEIGRDAARLTAHSIHSAWKQQAPQHRFVSKRNWFDGVFRRPVTNKAADTMMLRTKVCVTCFVPMMVWSGTDSTAAGRIWQAEEERQQGREEGELQSRLRRNKTGTSSTVPLSPCGNCQKHAFAEYQAPICPSSARPRGL